MKSSRIFYLLPVVCLAGFIAGIWGSNDELREFKERDKVEKEKIREARPDGFETFTKMVNIPESAGARHHGRPRSSAITNGAPVFAATNRPPRVWGGRRHESPENLRARIDAARDLWEARADVIRTQWVSRLQLSEESEKAFDAALQEMNASLYDCVLQVAESVGEDRVNHELGVKLVGGVMAVMAGAYDRIGECVAPELRAEVSEMNIADFIDPAVAEPLVKIDWESLRDRSHSWDAEEEVAGDGR